MDIYTIDFETYYDRQYSLSKMTTEAYIRDPQFEVIGASIKKNDGKAIWVDQPQVEAVFKHLKPALEKAAILAHNTLFDGAILSWHYGIKPKLWLDTLSMARPYHAAQVGGSLKALARHYKLGEKGSEVIAALGKRRADFTSDEIGEYAKYCCNDTDLTRELFKKLLQKFPPAELQVIDKTLRMYTEPELELDEDRLLAHEQAEIERKSSLVEDMGLQCTEDEAKAILMSNPKFAEYLDSIGVEPPIKISPRTGKTAFAFSKTDPGFKALLTHHDDRVVKAANARIGVKSTIELTRTQRLIQVNDRGNLPVMLNYYGAHTGRFSGGDKMNLQNFPRGGELRKSLLAPEGKRLVACDSSQIEARMLAWVAGQTDLVKAFHMGRDVYSEFASKIYNRPVTKDNKIERFVGKTCLGVSTRVLTRRGWVYITDVKATDRLWDGVEWVTHQGVSFMGVKPTISLSGVTVTPDHEILTGHTRWETALSVLENKAALKSALSLATLPSLDMKNIPLNKESLGGGNLYADVTGVSQSIHIQQGIYGKVDQQLVTNAQNVKPLTRDGGNTSQLWSMICAGQDYSTGCLPLSVDATTLTTKHTSPTVVEAYTYAVSGETTGSNFSDIYRPSVGGKMQRWIWTVLTTIKGICRGIYGSQQGHRIAPTSGVSTTWKPVYDILNSGSRNRFTILTNDGPIIVHNCILGLGYNMGWDKFMASLKSGAAGMRVDLDPSEAQRIVSLYRSDNRKIKALWKHAHTALKDMLDGKTGQLGNILTYDPDNGFQLPNGLHLKYNLLNDIGSTEYGPQYAYSSNPRMTLKIIKERMITGTVPTSGINWTYIYGGKVVENCLTGDTEVLTDRGWIRIIDVRLSDRLWDGCQWVRHDGLIHQGEHVTTVLNGVRMTPDHKVLTEEGWHNASSCEGLHRAGFWLPDGTEVSGDKRQTLSMAVPMQMRGTSRSRSHRRREIRETRWFPLMWMHAWCKKYIPQHVEASGICSMAVHAGQMQASNTPSVGKLWRSRHNGMQAMGKISRVLARYGASLQSWFNPRPGRQQSRLQQAELPLGYTQSTSKEHKKSSTCRYGQSRNSNGCFTVNSVLPMETLPVYDIRNAGPNSRFVVKGSNGPFIVHNCIQALARIVITEQLVEISKRYKVVLQVHDEIVIVCNEDEVEEAQAFVEQVMSTPPEWAPDLPVACEAANGISYGECK